MDHNYSILILSDDTSNAELVGNLLAGSGRTIFLSVNADARVADLRQADPDVLVFVFDDVRHSEDCLAAVRAASESLVRATCGGLILFCSKSDLQRAYELCQNQTFDDYVLFWPMSHDGARLPMVVGQALRRVEQQRRMAHAAAAPGTPRLSPEPALAEDTAPGPRPPADKPAGQATILTDRILFVEDDPMQHAVLQLMLEGSGVTAQFADTAKSAIAVLRSAVPRAILVDLNLPDMNGVDLVHWIRSQHALASTPVVMITGQRERSIVLQAMSAGTNDFIAKPYTRGTLLQKLSRLGAIP